MKGQSSILLVFCIVSGSLAKPPPTFLEYKDSLGQYSFGYSAPGSARSEVRSLDGSTRGSYSYVDDAGVIQTAQYTADSEHGFQIVATNLPRAPSPVEETPEVLAARLAHFKALAEASKLAEANPKDQGQQWSDAIDDKAADTIEIENASDSADEASNNKIEAKITKPEVAADSSAEPQSGRNIEVTKKLFAKIGIAESAGQSAQISEKNAQSEIMQPIESLQRAADSSRPNVPVVTTSFVIPGRVNLHSRVELDQPSTSAAARFSPEPFAARLGTMQSAMPQGQGANFDPSMITPAGTRMMAIAGNEKSAMLNQAAPLLAAPVQPAIGKAPLQYSAIVPSVAIAPSSVYSNYLTYGIGIDPIYHQNPYRYFPYGIL